MAMTPDRVTRSGGVTLSRMGFNAPGLPSATSRSYNTRFPAAEHSISVANRRSRVSSRLACMTHHAAAF